MLDSNVAAGATMVADPPKPALTPVVSPTTVLFLAALPASEAAGVAAIRVSRVNNDLNLEELNAQGATIIGFVLNPIVDAATKSVTGIGVMQMGSSGITSTLTPAQKSALSLITNELKQFRASATAGPTGLGLPGTAENRQRKSALGSWLGAIATGIDCGVAAVQGGIDPISDAGCVVAYGAWMDDSDDDGDVVDTAPPSSVYDGLGDLDPQQPGTSFQTTSQDGVDDPIGTPVGYGGSVGGSTDGSDDGASGGSGDGIDDKPGLQPQ
jgi:hypothetical protein